MQGLVIKMRLDFHLERLGVSILDKDLDSVVVEVSLVLAGVELHRPGEPHQVKVLGKPKIANVIIVAGREN